MRSRETTCYVVHECMREVDKFRKLDVGFWTLITKSLDKRIGTTARAGSCSCDTTFLRHDLLLRCEKSGAGMTLLQRRSPVSRGSGAEWQCPDSC